MSEYHDLYTLIHLFNTEDSAHKCHPEQQQEEEGPAEHNTPAAEDHHTSAAPAHRRTPAVVRPGALPADHTAAAATPTDAAPGPWTRRARCAWPCASS